ncbi:MAG TPA: methylated-DNA--[protein]-cysteine S-methyltransferase [Candidatus Limnocylindria bacterium]|nr:methylated-DNA--[protein]-cysteine S-methyltransferase [Candidatus Limnocylindria bacterium]
MGRPELDGLVYVAVRTTRIFCRPSCAARPLERNVTPFATARECVAAGYRACRRCHPEEIPPPPFAWRWIPTPLGTVLGAASDAGLLLLEFADRRGLPRELALLRRRADLGGTSARARRALDAADAWLEAYFAGRPPGALPLATRGTPFQRAVWEALRAIPAGETRSYGELARSLGAAGPRAVARANGANSVAIVVPCHRVIGADGSLTGYGGGLWRKQWLLDHERAMNLVN